MEWWEYLIVVGLFSVVWLVVVYKSHDKEEEPSTKRRILGVSWSHDKDWNNVDGVFDPIKCLLIFAYASFFLLLLIAYKLFLT